MNVQTRAITFIVVGMLCISVNDMLIKFLSDGYPLHQMVFVRSSIGLTASFAFLQMEGGWSLLRTDRPALHALRAVLIVVANMTYFAALAVMPLGAATALFFVAPLFILFRSWVWPEAGDLWIFAALGLMSALIGYSLSQAYRLGTAAVVASYEYVALPLAIFWGWAVFGEVPGPLVWLGIALIAGAGLAVFARERALARPIASARPIRRG